MAERQAESGTRLSAVEIHENILAPGAKELERSAGSLLWSSLASGLAVPVIPFLERRDRHMFLALLRVWGLLLVGNLVGAAVFGWTLAPTPMVEPALHLELARIAGKTTSDGFGHVLYAAVFAGWLIALLAWLLAATHATGAQIALIWLCTWPIAALGFRHPIAGSVEAFYRAASGTAGWGEMLSRFVIPSVIGNAIGGVLLVALLNYGQVVADRERKTERQGKLEAKKRRR